MRILFGGNRERGIACLDALLRDGHTIVAVLAHPSPDGKVTAGSVAEAAAGRGLPVLAPADVNAGEVIARLRALGAELAVLAGYGPIVRQPFIDLAPLGCINLHGGKLPQYRGSSPLNWALINGEREFGISIIQVDRGVDTGDILAEATFPIAPDDAIAEVQARANTAFPPMLLGVVRQLAAGKALRRKQAEGGAVYWPLRFPDDGLILFDQLTAEQVHNRVRALTDPYPAFSFCGGRKLKLLRSQLATSVHHGEPGRVYRKAADGLLVCAADRCLWIRRALLEDGTPAAEVISRYDKLATLRDLALARLKS